MTQRLFVESITSVGAVEAADNEPSKILFWKRKKQEPEPGRVEKEGSMSEAFDVDTLTDEGKAYVADLESQIATLSVEETPDALPDDLPDIVTKALDDQTATIEKEQVEKAALLKRVADLEDGIATEKWEARAKETEALTGDTEVAAPMYKAIASAAPEASATLHTIIDGLIVKDSMAPLFKELGDSSDGGTAQDKVTAIAAEIRKNSPDTTPAEARAQAWRENPELMAQNREEGN